MQFSELNITPSVRPNLGIFKDFWYWISIFRQSSWVKKTQFELNLTSFKWASPRSALTGLPRLGWDKKSHFESHPTLTHIIILTRNAHPTQNLLCLDLRYPIVQKKILIIRSFTIFMPTKIMYVRAESSVNWFCKNYFPNLIPQIWAYIDWLISKLISKSIKRQDIVEVLKNWLFYSLWRLHWF